VGYLSYDARHADLLFEVVTRRYERGKSILLTTNKPFAEWPTTFPNAACVVTLVDRLLHRAIDAAVVAALRPRFHAIEPAIDTAIGGRAAGDLGPLGALHELDDTAERRVDHVLLQQLHGGGSRPRALAPQLRRAGRARPR